MGANGFFDPDEMAVLEEDEYSDAMGKIEGSATEDEEDESEEASEPEGEDSGEDDDVEEDPPSEKTPGDEGQTQEQAPAEGPEDDGGDTKEAEEAPGNDPLRAAGIRYDPQNLYTQEEKEQLAALQEKLDEGDIEPHDFYSKREEVMLNAMNRQAGEQVWENEQAMFFSAHPDLADGPKQAAFQGVANAVLAEAEWAAKSGTECLHEARRRMEEAFGASAPRATGNEDKSKPEPEETVKGKTRRKASQKQNSADVKTIGDAPAAGQNSEANSEFAKAEKLLSEGKEDQFAEMTANWSSAKHEKFLSGAR